MFMMSSSRKRLQIIQFLRWSDVRRFWKRPLLLLLSLPLLGCSFAYDQGVRLEAEERWEEASISYREAVVANPDNSVYREALQRANRQVAQENLQRYREYLAAGEGVKAFARLQAVRQQDPDLAEAAEEEKLWSHALLSGRVQFEFEQLQTNVRLADEMQLQIRFNTPAGKTISAPISSESGIFFVEDLTYRQNPQIFAQYSVQSIGLQLVRSEPSGLSRREYQKFIDFREIQPLRVQGQLDFPTTMVPSRYLISDRSRMLLRQQNPQEWNPPRLVQYELLLQGDRIAVRSTDQRREFAADILYWNLEDQRALLDFGVYDLRFQEENRNWTIRRQDYQEPTDDYLLELADNLALSPYFFYSGIAYPFISQP